MTRPGLWCDVFAVPDGIALAYTVDKTLYVEFPHAGVKVACQETPRYVRAFANPTGAWMSVGQGQDTGALIVNGVRARDANGNIRYVLSKPAIRWDGSAFVIYYQPASDGQIYIRWNTATGQEDTFARPGGSAGGILQVDVDGVEEVRFYEDWASKIPGCLYPIEAQGWYFGQGAEHGLIGVNKLTGERILAADCDPMMPRAAYWNGSWRVCSWVQDGSGVVDNMIPPFVPLQPPEPIPVHVELFNRLMNISVFGDEHGDAPHNVPAIGPFYPLSWIDHEYAEDHGIDIDALCDSAPRPLIHYAPPTHRSRLAANLQSGDSIWTPAYRAPGESLTAFDERATAEILGTLAYGQDVEIVCGATAFNGLTEQQALECFPLYRGLADLSPRIRGLRFFSWAQNSGGAKYHPEMQHWLSAYLAASPGPYVPSPIPPPVVRESARRRRMLFS